jgi:hypothetical protein
MITCYVLDLENNEEKYSLTAAGKKLDPYLIVQGLMIKQSGKFNLLKKHTKKLKSY